MYSPSRSYTHSSYHEVKLYMAALLLKSSLDMEACTPFPAIPTEILRDILELAAESSRPTALVLTLTSTHIRNWTLPILYHTVLLSSSRTLSQFIHAICPTEPPTRLTPAVSLRHRVQNLGITALGPVQMIEKVLTACDRLESLACSFSLASYSHNLASTTKLPLLAASPHEQHFLGLSCRDGLDQALLSSSTTHLHLQLTSQTLLSLTNTDTNTDIYHHLPSLTHLALSIPSTTPTYTLLPALTALLDSKTLAILLVQVTGSESATIIKDVDQWNKLGTGHMTGGVHRDSRLVAIKGPLSAVRQWEDSLFCGGVWRKAETEIEARKQKERQRRKSVGRPMRPRRMSRMVAHY